MARVFCRGPDNHYFRLCSPDVGGTHSTALVARSKPWTGGKEGAALPGRLHPLLQAGAGLDATQSPPFLLLCQVLLFSLSLFSG